MSLTAASVYGAMNDIVEAIDIDGQLYVSGHNLPQFMERATERGAEREQLRIMDIIRERIENYSRFIEACMDQDVEITPSVLCAVVELRSLLRKIQEGGE